MVIALLKNIEKLQATTLVKIFIAHGVYDTTYKSSILEMPTDLNDAI